MIADAADQPGVTERTIRATSIMEYASKDERVLVLMLDAGETDILCAALAERGIQAVACPAMAQLCYEIEHGAGAAIIAGEALVKHAWACLVQVLSRQSSWSDFPLIVLTDGEATMEAGWLVLRSLEPVGNATLLERPVTAPMLTSAVQVALRARRRQYETRDRLRESQGQEEAWQQAEEILRTAKEQLSRHASELEQRVVERTRNLHASIQSLEGVLYHVAHDLRAPLRTMQGFTTILLEEYAPPLGEEGVEYARRISLAATRMDRLIQDLLAYGRLAYRSSSPANLDLDRQFKQVLNILANDIRACNAAVQVVQPLPKVRADPGILEMILTQLLKNALVFVAPGVEPQIQIRAEHAAPGMVRIFVQDNGLGVAAEHHDRIFRVFERLQPEDVNKSTGIGLAIVRKGAERMGGAAGVESKLGAGSRFWVDLPAAPNK